MADDCLDEYTDHGHCGLLTDAGDVDNDATLERYAAIAIAQADAGADVVAPSGMMDGQVGAIRAALDAVRPRRRRDPRLRGEVRVGALRPVPRRRRVRAAVRRPARLPDGPAERARGARRGRARRRRGRRHGDGEAGARRTSTSSRALRDAFDVPVAAYHVSGEYAMLKAAAAATAGSTATPSRSRCSRRSSAPAPTSCSRTSPARSPNASRERRVVRRARRRAIPGGVDSPVRAFASVGGEPFFVARAEGAYLVRHRRPPLPRLRAVVGRVDPRARAPGGRRGGAARRGRRHVVRRAHRTRGRARRGDRRAGAVGREGAAGVVGHRGGDDRGAPRPRRHRPRRRS